MAASAHDFSFTGIDGKHIHLKDYLGKPVLVVNVASLCGFTPQYTELQALHEKYKDKGLVVLGVPSNDFGAQEPNNEGAIRKFCETRYGVTFPMTAKQKVIGVDAHGLYDWINGHAPEAGAPTWNFHKYLFDRKGHLAGSWGGKVDPMSREITDRIEKVLAT
jgi:glutathione peroxidase